MAASLCVRLVTAHARWPTKGPLILIVALETNFDQSVFELNKGIPKGGGQLSSIPYWPAHTLQVYEPGVVSKTMCSRRRKMSTEKSATETTGDRLVQTPPPLVDFDAIVVGAGFSGLGLIHYLREINCSVRVFDNADDIGGTWTWNRYPGARVDSEAYYYCLTFSEEMLQEWKWTERYPGWEETLSYLHYVADKNDMRKDIQLNTTVTDASV